MKRLASDSSADGVLQPVVNDRRFLYFIGQRRMVQLETGEDSKGDADTIAVGNYRFSRRAFAMSVEYLDECFRRGAGRVIIDEAGLLELKGEGIDAALKPISRILGEKPELRVMVVIRKKLLNEMMLHYGWSGEDAVVIEEESGLGLFFT